MHAYPETLLADARSQMADMLDYVVHDLKMDADEYFPLFIASDCCVRIERGDKAIILGVSGIELAQTVISSKTGRREFPAARQILKRTPAYWAGWIVSSYQWQSNRTFSEIHKALSFVIVLEMYPVYHEAPEERFFEAADRMVSERFPETRLKRIRSAFGCSQSELARISGVGLRSIQMYEQRRKNINRAAGETIRSLARALGCSVDDILEP